MRLCGWHGLGHGYIKGRMRKANAKANAKANVGGIRCFDAVDKASKHGKGDMGWMTRGIGWKGWV